MGKGRSFGSVAVVALAVASLGGCGQSNDQGISFHANGFTDTGQSLPLSCRGPINTSIVLQNRMLQGLELQRVDLAYRVSASRAAIPNDQAPLSDRLGPSSGQEPSNPPNKNEKLAVVSENILSQIRGHLSQYPPLPFTLVVRAAAVAVSDSGDVFRTNTVSYPVVLEDGDCGTSGAKAGSGSGSTGG